MQTLRIYTSSPASTQLAGLALGLERPGQRVVLLPLAQLPTGSTPHPPRRLSLLAELHDLRQRRLAVDKALSNVEAGLYDGDPAGLRFEQDALGSRIQGIERALDQPRQQGGAGAHS